VFLYGHGDDVSRFKEAIRRARAYHEAGADCIFLMRLTDRSVIRQIVPEIGCPVNIMTGPDAPGAAELEQLGVARVTFGTGPIRATLPLVRRMAQDLRLRGASPALEQTEFSHATVNDLFGSS
jgi:2-methylisocitrate lyase-like PEP mutase family enzyme